jgi:hypothetical protein
VDEYDRRTLYPMFLKCYHHLHPITKSIGCVDQTSEKNSSLDIFQQLHPQVGHQRNLSPRNH